jgi:diguanylate cyclase (GGDEF)-like protein
MAPDDGAAWPRRAGAVPGRDIEGLLQAVVTEVGTALDFWSVDLWAFSEDADTLACRAWWCRDADAGARSCVGVVVGLDQSHDLRRLVLTAEAMERHAGEDLSPADAAALAQSGFTSRIDVPLLAGAEVLGVLSLSERRSVRRLSNEERARLGSLARLGAAVLHAARLYEAETGRAGRLADLLSTGRGLSAASSAADIAAALREELAGLVAGIPCDVELYLRRDDGTYAPLGAAETAGAEHADAIARQAVQLGRPEQARRPDGATRLVAPLVAGEAALGYVEVVAPLGRKFRAREVELAVLLAGQTAAALDRAKTLRLLQSRTTTDPVSGLFSRWYFFERLYAEVARARRYREPLALLVAEVDGAELLLTEQGPRFRDAVLAAVARLVLSSLRDRVDVACRLAGGRFALLLPNTPPGADAAGLVAERIRARVAGTHLADDEAGELGRFTLSLGMAGYPEAAEDADELIVLAEARLGTAQAAGGDRIEPPLPVPEDEDAAAPEKGPA